MAAPPGIHQDSGGSFLGAGGTRRRQIRFANFKDLLGAGAGQGIEKSFTAELLAFFNATGAPFNTMQSWRELFLNTTTAPHGSRLLNQPYGRSDKDYDQAVVLHPPAVLLHHRNDDFGRTQYLIQPMPTVCLARITQVVPAGPGFNKTYFAETFDRSYRTPSALTPVDRWPGPNYVPKAVNALVFLLIQSATVMHLFAFESPDLNPCPGPAPSPSPASSSSFALTAGI